MTDEYDALWRMKRLVEEARKIARETYRDEPTEEDGEPSGKTVLDVLFSLLDYEIYERISYIDIDRDHYYH